MLQESTCTPDTQPSFATTGPFLYNESFFSQVSQVKKLLCKIFII